MDHSKILILIVYTWFPWLFGTTLFLPVLSLDTLFYSLFSHGEISHTGIHYACVKMSFSLVNKQPCDSWWKTEEVTAICINNHLLERLSLCEWAWRGSVGVRRGYRLKYYWRGVTPLMSQGDYFNRTHPLGPWQLMASVARLGWHRHALY